MNRIDNTKPQADNKGLNALLGYADKDTTQIIAKDDFLFSLNQYLKRYPLLKHNGSFSIDSGSKAGEKIDTSNKAIAVLVDSNLQPASLALITPNSNMLPELTEPSQPYGLLIGEIDSDTNLWIMPTLQEGVSLYKELAVKANQNIAVIAGLNKWHFQAMVKYYSNNRRLMVTTTFDNKDKFIEPLKGVDADAIITQQAPLYELSRYPYSYDEVMADAQIIDLKAVGHPKPKPISQTLPPVKTITSDMLPSTLWQYVDNQADRLSTPHEYIGVPLLIALASAIGTKVSIFPKMLDDWETIPNLWGAIIGNPSTKKSPALSAGVKPLHNLTFKATEEYKQVKKDFATQKEVNEFKTKAAREELKKLAKQQATQTDDTEKPITDDDLRAKAQSIAEASEADETAPLLKRYITDDSTYQKLGELLSQTHNGLLVERDELTGLLASLDGEGNDEARSFYLEAYNGTGSKIMDRIGRGSIFIENHCLSLVGGIQPDKLERYLSRTVKGLGNDGLMQRFQLSVYPDHIKGRKEKDIAVNKEIRQAVYDLFDEIDSMTIGDFLKYGACEPDDFCNRPHYRFTKEAASHFLQWYDQNTAKAEASEHTVIAEHLMKYTKTVPSLALIFHLIDCIEYGRNLGGVSLTALQTAIKWQQMLETHMYRIYSIVTDSAMTKATYLADKILNIVKLGGAKSDKSNWLEYGFNARNLKRKNWKGLTRQDGEDVNDALDILIEHDWLKSELTYSGMGRPTERYYINPRLTELL